MSMRVKGIVDEDFINYKKPSMFISTYTCDFKCCREQGLDISVCQNSEIASQPTIEIPTEVIYERYISNDITSAVVIGGLEPFKQTEELYELINCFRRHSCYDDFVIYTGYNKDEIGKGIQISLYNYGRKNILIKYGRYIPGHKSHYDENLGVNLASDNQRSEWLC